MVQQDPQINGVEITEPSPKVRKLDHGGVNGLLRVKKLSEKAVLPYRASPFAAGYDLCSYRSLEVSPSVKRASANLRRRI
ncbi:hypothetical protein RHMOL_Rhmol06G0044900 [Rhododendron molle]|uniref:Uncharacterized protein n=1 Tax=Rhododendron molle TaxID=49168 RepID=A0ACC0NA01_RHOML|nr:hypothetical protein RHMOL_Rhmol06G0044900 [Rhododendron molle]